LIRPSFPTRTRTCEAAVGPTSAGAPRAPWNFTNMPFVRNNEAKTCLIIVQTPASGCQLFRGVVVSHCDVSDFKNRPSDTISVSASEREKVMTNIEHIDKAGAWHRLKREGRLEAFNARREQLRAELKEKGMKRKNASHEAWRLAIEEFSPVSFEASDVEDQGRDDGEQDNPLHWDYPEELMPPPRPYNGCDTLWAYDRMVLKSTQEADAPSPGAWGLLLWGRQNPHAFYFQLLPKAFQAYEKRAHEEQPVKSEPKTVQERLTMFTDFVQRCEAEKKRRGLGDMEMLHSID